jgi:hypothetical protein
MANGPGDHERQKCEVVMDDPEQSRRFIEAARELGIEEVGEAYRQAVTRILPPRKPGEPVPNRGPRPKPAGTKGRSKSPG